MTVKKNSIRGLIGRFYCWIGFHDYGQVIHEYDPQPYRECNRCGDKLEVHVW